MHSRLEAEPDLDAAAEVMARLEQLMQVAEPASAPQAPQPAPALPMVTDFYLQSRRE